MLGRPTDVPTNARSTTSLLARDLRYFFGQDLHIGKHSLPGVVFDVNPVTGTSYIARAFFPSYARVNRNVLFNTADVPNGSGVWTLRGVLRHELGHYAAARNHWLANGINEGRRASREFDAAFDLAFNADVRAAYGATTYAGALDLWLVAGISEGRRSAADFDLKAYLARYPDLRAAYGDTNYAAALFHWRTAGASEGRNPAP
jgi:hypothetical protein